MPTSSRFRSSAMLSFGIGLDCRLEWRSGASLKWLKRTSGTRTSVPRLASTPPMPFDQRMMSFKSPDHVSLLTLEGRMLVPFVMGKYQVERFGFAKGQCDLVLRKDGKWFLLVTVDLPEGTKTPVTDFLGVDLGIVNIAVDSDGNVHTGEAVEKIRRKHQTSARPANGRAPRAPRNRSSGWQARKPVSASTRTTASPRASLPAPKAPGGESSLKTSRASATGHRLDAGNVTGTRDGRSSSSDRSSSTRPHWLVFQS